MSFLPLLPVCLPRRGHGGRCHDRWGILLALLVLRLPLHVRSDQLVHRVPDLLQRRREVPLLVDVAEEFLGQQELSRGEREHLELLPEMVDEVLGLDRDRLGVLQLLVLLAGAAHLEAVEEDLLPVHLLFLLLLLLLLLRVLLLRRLLLRLEQLQEGVGEQLLLEVLLEIHHGHVQHVHGLVEPGIDPELLPQAGMLGKTGSHATASRRARRRAVRVGPRYSCATRSSYTRSRTLPLACTFPSNMM